MIYVHIYMELWLPKVCGVVLHIRLLRIWSLYRALYGI